MSLFLASSVKVVKSDGTSVTVNSGESPGETPATPGQTVALEKHHRSNSDGMDGTVVPVVAIVFVFLWLIIKALMAPFTQRGGQRARAKTGGAEPLSDEEQAILVKLQKTIVQMEQRIESLETILIDEHRTKEKYGNKI